MRWKGLHLRWHLAVRSSFSQRPLKTMPSSCVFTVQVQSWHQHTPALMPGDELRSSQAGIPLTWIWAWQSCLDILLSFQTSFSGVAVSRNEAFSPSFVTKIVQNIGWHVWCLRVLGVLVRVIKYGNATLYVSLWKCILLTSSKWTLLSWATIVWDPQMVRYKLAQLSWTACIAIPDPARTSSH